MKLDKKELLEISGGVNITGTFVSSIIRGITVLSDLGRIVGSAIRRLISNNICPI